MTSPLPRPLTAVASPPTADEGRVGGAARESADAQVEAPGAARAGGTVLALRDLLRAAIIKGELRAGAPLSSVQLARTYGVSRTPLREALRMLEEEGFVTTESNMRARVATWSSDELEALFAQRILLTALCTRLTVPRLTSADLDRMGQLLADMDRAEADNDDVAWRAADSAFHLTHMMLAPPALLTAANRLYDRASMFRHTWLGQRRTTISLSPDDHPKILEACIRRDHASAANTAAEHLARVALMLVTQADPARDPACVPEALRLVTFDLSETSLRKRPEGRRPRSRPQSDVPRA
jgi:DNA-binding GntR family transcriptional regulator